MVTSSLGPKAIKQNLEIAQQLREQGQLDEAIATYQKLIELEPNRLSFYVQLARVQEEKGDLEGAIDSYENILELKLDNPKIHAKLAKLYLKKEQGNLDKAIESYQQHIARNPKLPFDFIEKLSLALEEEGREQTKESLQITKQKRENGLLNEVTIKNLLAEGNLLKKQGELNQALEKYQQVFDLASDAILALDNLGEIYEEKKEFERAINCYKLFLESQNLLQAKLARAIFKTGNVKKALEVYQKTISHRWNNVPEWALVEWADALKRSRRFDEALAVYQKIIELSPNKYSSYIKIAKLYQKLGKIDEAIESYRRAIKLNENLPFVIQDELRVLLQKQEQKYDEFVANLKISEPKKYNLVVVATFKNEAPYILEWIAYYLALKVDHFYIYNNDSTDETPEILESLDRAGIITYIDWPSKPNRDNQTCAYRDAWFRLRGKCEWLAILDGDEFIVPHQHDDLQSFLSDYEDVDGIAINWKFFGSSGLIERSNDLVIERFKKCAIPNYQGHRTIKSISRVDSIKSVGIHSCKFLSKCIFVSPNKIRLKSGQPKQKYINHDIIQVNHYFTKSKVEWELKKSRGKANYELQDAERIRNDRFFDKNDRNEQEDLTIINFLEKTKQNIQYLQKVTGLKYYFY
jgi:tetratricopeptide (TPR) repeat protein